MTWSRSALGLPLEGGSLDGLTLQFLAWATLILAGLIVALYLGIILIASVVASVLFAARSLSWKEAVDYTLRSKYPKRWYVSKN